MKLTGDRYRKYWQHRIAKSQAEVGRGPQASDETTAEQGRRIWQEVEGILPPRADVVYELGAGWGRMTRRLAARYPHRSLNSQIFAVDLCSEALRRGDFGYATRIQGDALPVLVAKADLVFTCTVLQHITDPPTLARAARSIEDALGENGMLVLYENVAPSRVPHRIDFRVEDYIRLFPKIEFERWWVCDPMGEGEDHAVLVGRKRGRPLEGKRIAVALRSGIGNCTPMLPAIRALHLMGADVSAIDASDKPEIGRLFERCTWLSKVMRHGAGAVRNFEYMVPGYWGEPGGYARKTLEVYPRDDVPEAEVPMEALRTAFGWRGAWPDVSDWCRNLDRTIRWDVGIANTSKPHPNWTRKRYPHMPDVARMLGDQGFRVAIFGQKHDRDGSEEYGEDLIGRIPLHELPDFLAGCRLMIAADGGVGHLAASLGVPTMMFFGATDIAKTSGVGPVISASLELECQPCFVGGHSDRWDACKDWICRDFPPGRIVDLARSLLRDGNPNPPERVFRP